MEVQIHLLVMDELKLLRDFKTLVSCLLLHVPSAKVRAPCLDDMNVDPWHCDPMTTITPPPELLSYFDLEDFLSARRIRPLLLIQAHLMDFVCTPGNTISFDFDILEYFTIPRVPCISGITSNSYRRSMTINGSHKLWGPNMRTLYQSIRPPHSGKFFLDSTLTWIVNLPAHRDQRQG
jgi:hypothetical protein